MDLLLGNKAHDLEGLTLLYKVKSKGGASPKTCHPLKGTQRRISLGHYPILGVKQARETAMNVLQ